MSSGRSGIGEVGARVIEYLVKGLATLFIGFFPLAEIYVAVPGGIAMGLSAISAVVWSVIGNYLPVPIIHVFYDKLIRIPKLGPWLLRRATPQVKATLDRHGSWFVFVVTPWIGVWIVAAVAKVFGMDKQRIFLVTFLSISAYAVACAALVVAGVDLLSD
jgi:uncharacterized membrane protein